MAKGQLLVKVVQHGLQRQTESYKTHLARGIMNQGKPKGAPTLGEAQA